MLKQNQKGQEEAPFELLVAVIVMGFVIMMGLMAMNKLREEQCFAKTDKALEEFKSQLETVVTQKSPQHIQFRLSDCFDPAKEEVRIVDWDDVKVCSEWCMRSKITCTTIEYFNRSTSSRSMRKCIDISPETVFQSETSRGPCESIDTESEHYRLQDFKTTAPQGSYLVVNKTSVADIRPVICAYLRVD